MLTLNLSGPLAGIVYILLIAAVLLLLIWLLAWLKDVRAELRSIRRILQNRFSDKLDSGE